MSRFRLAAKLRQNDYWAPMVRLLDESGVTEWDVEDGGAHPKVTFTYRGVVLRVPIPSTPSARGSKHYVIGKLRREMRNVELAKG